MNSRQRKASFKLQASGLDDPGLEVAFSINEGQLAGAVAVVKARVFFGAFPDQQLHALRAVAQLLIVGIGPVRKKAGVPDISYVFNRSITIDA